VLPTDRLFRRVRVMPTVVAVVVAVAVVVVVWAVGAVQRCAAKAQGSRSASRRTATRSHPPQHPHHHPQARQRVMSWPGYWSIEKVPGPNQSSSRVVVLRVPLLKRASVVQVQVPKIAKVWLELAQPRRSRPLAPTDHLIPSTWALLPPPPSRRAPWSLSAARVRKR